MSGVNQITIVGNVGAAPELNYGQNNQPYCRFSVAVNEQWKNNGEKRERVTWFPVVAFNGLSENCAAYLERGRAVAVIGRVQTREYEDREGQCYAAVGSFTATSVSEGLVVSSFRTPPLYGAVNDTADSSMDTSAR